MVVPLLFVFKIGTRIAFAVDFFYEEDDDRKKCFRLIMVDM